MCGNSALHRRCGGARPPPARVRGNDWRAVAVADLAGFVPAEPLSVVIPCYGSARALERTLAALERQRFPRELFETVIVDDGSQPPLAAPRDTPLAVRVVRQPRRGFGLARARNNGVRAARHDIVVFLDADLMAGEELLAAHARWHHAVSDAVTLGFCAYVDVDGLDAEDVRGRPGRLGELLHKRPVDRPWTERHMARTDDLTGLVDDLFRTVVGNNLGIRRTLFDELGGFDEAFDRYGWEDTEFGWRAQTRGALLVPAREAFAWHQGRFVPNRSAAKRRAVAGQAAKGAERIAHPDFRGPAPGFPVPRTVVTVRPAGPGAAAAVQRLLAGDDADLAVLAAAGPGCDRGELDRLRQLAGGDGRLDVAPVCDAAAAFPATPFFVELPPDAAVGPRLLHRLRAGLGAAAVGVATLPGGGRARIERAWAVHRARRAGGRPEDYGETVAFEVSPSGRMARPGVHGPRSLLPAVRRPLTGPARLLAEVRRARSGRDLARIARWLWRGLVWQMALRRGLRAGRRRVPPRAAQLAALAARRACSMGPADLAAAAGLLAAAVPRRDSYGASAARLALAVGAVPGCGLADGLAGSLAKAARSAAQSDAAAEIAAALAAGDHAAALSMARTAARAPDLQAEKIVSRRYRFVWLANPKAASRSLIRALRDADPDAALVREATLAEVHAAFPEARGYFSFAFVRHPLERVLSCHGDKVLGDGIIDLAAFAGLERGMDLEAFCAWLETPWGSDAFADRHWLSQDILLRESPDAPLPDFLGRFERLEEDFASVAAGLGLPCRPLPHRNRGMSVAAAPSERAAAALARRYARDFALFGYPAPSPGTRS